MATARAIAPWALGAVLTFLVVSVAFLILARLGTEPAEVSLEPRQPPLGSESPLGLQLDEDRLSSLKATPGQKMTLTVENSGEKESLKDISVVVEVSSEDTSAPDTRLYRKTISGIPPGDSEEVPFELDLSPPEDAGGSSDPPREIIEVRVATPGGASEVRTVLLPS